MPEKVIPVVASTALAKRMERCGADAVIAEGCESGGHVGETTTMALVPQVVDVVENIPVIAAGGIGDGRGSRRLSCWGAKGVQGTFFVATKPRFMKTTSRPSSRRRISTPG